MSFKLLVPLLLACTFACNNKNLAPPTSVGDADGDGIPDDQDETPNGDGSNGSSGNTGPVEKNYGVGGTVSGLKRLGLTLTQGGETLEIQGNGAFVFPTRLADGAAYSVSITAQPLRQICSLTGADGVIAGADALGISVTCVDAVTVGGTLYGLNTGATITLTNAGEQLVVSANGAFTFRTAMLNGTAYDVTLVSTTSQTVSCTVLKGAGVAAAADITDVTVHCLTGTQPVFASAGDWNTYFRYQRNGQNQLVPTACTGSEIGHYGRCLHGGERRQVDLPGVPTCITNAADELLAFEWQCELLPGGGGVRYTSRGLKAGKGLADLIDFDTGTFKDNRLVLNSAGVFIRTPFSKWWANTIVVDSVDALNASGTIYAYKSNPGRTFAIPAAGTRVSIVLKRGVIGTATAAANETLVTVADVPFVWIEGSFDATGDDDGLVLTNSRFSVLNQVTLVGATKHGLVLNGARATMVRDVQIANTAEEGIAADNAQSVTYRRVSVSFSGQGGGKSAVRMTTSNNPIAEQLFISNQLANTVSAASLTLDTVVGGVFTQLTIAQSQGIGLRIVNGEENSFLGFTLHDNASAGVAISGTSKNNRLMQGVYSRTGGTVFADTSASPSTVQIDVATVTSGDATPFVNTSGAPGNVSNWFGPFDHPLQCWAKADATACAGVVCLKKDFGVLAADVLIKDTVNAPNVTDIFKHVFVPTITSQAGCDAQFPGTKYVAADARCETIALRAAVELAGDDYGLDNALCETHDQCIFVPNRASDLGFGALVTRALGGSPSGSPDKSTPDAFFAYASNGR